MKTWALLILGMLLIAWVTSDITLSITGLAHPQNTAFD